MLNNNFAKKQSHDIKKLINLIEDNPDYTLDIIQKLKVENLPVFIYGAGAFANHSARALLENKILVSAFVVDDQYFSAYNDHIIVDNRSFSIIPYSKLSEMLEPFSIIIAWVDYKKACDSMCKLKTTFPQLASIYYFDAVPFHRLNYRDVLANIAEYEKSFNLFDDQLSKDIFTAHINSKIIGLPGDLIKLKDDHDGNYALDLLLLSENDSIIDCGSFIGDTIEEFLSYSKKGFKKVYAFEPDPNNYEILKKITKKYPFVVCVQKGVHKTNTVLHFNTLNNMGSAISETGSSTVEVVSIDDHVKGEEITVIKMDIEGSELDALKGAKNTIVRYMPKLAICVYHKNEDLYTIPLYVQSLIEDNKIKKYKYYLRHHGNSFEETVLYAIPYMI